MLFRSGSFFFDLEDFFCFFVRPLKVFFIQHVRAKGIGKSVIFFIEVLNDQPIVSAKTHGLAGDDARDGRNTNYDQNYLSGKDGYFEQLVHGISF